MAVVLLVWALGGFLSEIDPDITGNGNLSSADNLDNTNSVPEVGTNQNNTTSPSDDRNNTTSPADNQNNTSPPSDNQNSTNPVEIDVPLLPPRQKRARDASSTVGSTWDSP